MADAFRGLTIRLAADERPLTSALNNVKRSAGLAQSQISKITRALNAGGNDAAAMSARINLMQDKIALSATAAQKLSSTWDKVGANIKEAAAAGTNFHAEANRAGENVKTMEKRLQIAHDTLAAAALKSEKFREKLIAAKAAAEDISLKQARADFEKMSNPEKLKAALVQIKALSRQLMSDSTRDSAFSELKGYANSISRAQASALGTFDENNFVRAKQYVQLLEQMKVKRKELAEIRDEKNDRLAQSNILYELTAERAQLKANIAAMTQYKAELMAAGMAGSSLEKANDKLRQTKSAADMARTSAQRMSEVFREATGSSIKEAAKAKLTALRSEIASTSEAISAMKAKQKSLEETPGFDKALASSEKLYSVLKKTESEYNAIQREVAEMQARLHDAEDRRDTNAPGKENAKAKEYEKALVEVEKLNGKLDELRRKEAAAESAFERANIAKEYRQTNEELVKTEAHLEKIKNMSSGGGFLSNAARSIRTMGYGLYSTLTPAILMAGRYAVMAADDIDSAYRDMRKTVNGTEEDFQTLRQGALEFSRTHFTSADQLLEIESIGGQLGIGVDKLQTFAETVANLDIATNIDADTVAEQLGKMGSVMGLTEDQYTRFGDSLVRLGNNLPVMESDIMTVATRFMGMGKVVGMSADQMLGWSAAASATGQKSEAAGSSMQRFISNVETAAVNGGEKLETFAKISGMSAQEFSKAFKEDASGTLYKFIDGLGNMQKRGESVNQALAELGINNVRDKQLLEGLAVQMANAGEGASILAQALGMSSDAYKGCTSVMQDGSIELAGDAAREAGKKTEGFSGQLQEMKNAAQVLGMTLLDSAVPALEFFKGMFEGLTGAVSSLPDPVKRLIVGLTGLAAAAGPIAVAFGAIVDGAGKIKIAIESMKAGRIWSSLTTETNQYKQALAQTQASIAKVDAAQARFKQNIGMTSSSLSRYRSELVQLESAQKKALNVSRLASFGNALKGIAASVGVMMAITAAITAIDMLVQKLDEGVEKANRWRDATKGLGDALANSSSIANSARSEIAGAADGLGTYASNMEAAEKATENLITSNIALKDKIHDTMVSMGTGLGYVDSLRSSIKALGDTDGRLTSEQLAKLKIDIENVNKAAGDTLSVGGNASNGYYLMRDGARLAKEEIDKLCESLENQIRLQSYSTLAQESQNDLTEANIAVASSQKAVNEALGDYKGFVKDSMEGTGQWTSDLASAVNSAQSLDEVLQAFSDRGIEAPRDFWGDYTQKLSDAENQLKKDKELRDELVGVNTGLRSSVELLTEAQDSNSDALTKSIAGNSSLLDAFVASGSSITQFRDDLKKLGVDSIESANINEATAAKIAAAYKSGDFTTIGQILDSLGIKFNENASKMTGDMQALVDGYTNALTNMGTTSDWFTQKANQAGFLGESAMQRFAVALNEAGISSQRMTEMGKNGFDSLMYAASNDIGNIQFALQALNAIPCEPKEMKVTENGIEDVNGKLWTMDAQARTITDGEHVFKINDDGSLEDITEKVKSVPDEKQITFSSNSDEVAAGAEEAAGAIEDVPEDHETEYDDNSDEAVENAENVTEAVNNVPDEHQINVYVTGGAEGTLQSIINKLSEINDKEITVTTNEVTVKRAAGGILREFASGGVLRNIRVPMHAAGSINGIVTGPTMTNVGLTGEAGAEAIMHMRHAGGAIVPLSNRRYVRPFARAVASEIGGGGTVYNVNVNLSYDASADATDLARDMTREFRLALERGA